MAQNSNIDSYNNIKKDYQNYFEKIEKICFKKCGPSLNNPVLSVAEKSCLQRCVMKFKEAEQFGKDTFQYLKTKVENSQ